LRAKAIIVLSMAWLVCDGKVLASCEVATTRAERRKGLLGRSGIEGALLITHTRSVHTVGMQFPIDAIFCDAELMVLAIKHVDRLRLPIPPRGTRNVVETERGAAERWELCVGDQLEVRD
jgi:uncharacterized membrane protein (UPF0127 family)